MNRYYVHNKTKKAWCLIDSTEDMQIGQIIFVKFDNEDIDELCECEILQVMNNSES